MLKIVKFFRIKNLSLQAKYFHFFFGEVLPLFFRYWMFIGFIQRKSCNSFNCFQYKYWFIKIFYFFPGEGRRTSTFFGEVLPLLLNMYRVYPPKESSLELLRVGPIGLSALFYLVLLWFFNHPYDPTPLLYGWVVGKWNVFCAPKFLICCSS